jgi:hypothetical protein
MKHYVYIENIHINDISIVILLKKNCFLYEFKTRIYRFIYILLNISKKKKRR